MGAMLQLRLVIPADLTEDVVLVLSTEPSVSGLAVMRGASLLPKGDIVHADVAREHANPVITRLRDLGDRGDGARPGVRPDRRAGVRPGAETPRTVRLRPTHADGAVGSRLALASSVPELPRDSG